MQVSKIPPHNNQNDFIAVKILKYLLGFFAVLLALDGGVEIDSILTISSTFTQAL